jgi:hypothetical protein
LKGYSVSNVQEEDIPGFDYFSLGNRIHYNRQNFIEQTPLMFAIIAGNTNAVNQLMAKPELNLTVSCTKVLQVLQKIVLLFKDIFYLLQGYRFV